MLIVQGNNAQGNTCTEIIESSSSFWVGY